MKKSQPGTVTHPGGLRTPFTAPLCTDTKANAPGAVFDRNVCSHFSEPRDPDHDGDPEVFFAGVNGKDWHGKIEGATTLNSPMSGMATPSDPRPGK